MMRCLLLLSSQMKRKSITKSAVTFCNPLATRAQFRRDHAEPLWKNFRLWAASAILGLPKDTNIFKALNYMLRNYTELTNYMLCVEAYQHNARG